MRPSFAPRSCPPPLPSSPPRTNRILFLIEFKLKCCHTWNAYQSRFVSFPWTPSPSPIVNRCQTSPECCSPSCLCHALCSFMGRHWSGWRLGALLTDCFQNSSLLAVRVKKLRETSSVAFKPNRFPPLLTASLPSSKSTFSQRNVSVTWWEIDIIIIFHLSINYEKPSSSYYLM